jgi:branched-chain amino acid transport system substrate-binding protein
MKKYKLPIVLAIIIILIIVLSRNKSEGDTIKIGGAFIQTGPVALIGEFQINAAKLAVEDINAAGGVNGKKVELFIEDSTYDPKQALSAYQALKLKGLNYIIADGSPVVGAIHKTAITDGKLMMVPGATLPSYFDDNSMSCRIALTAKSFGPAYTELLGKKGYKKVATFLPDNEYGRGLAAEFDKAFIAAGGQIVLAEFYNAAAGVGDYRTSIAKIKAVQKDIDAIVVVQVANTVEPMFKQIKELGITKPMVSDYYTVKNPAMKDLSLVNGVSLVDYEYVSEASAADTEATAKFKAAYKAKYGKDPIYLAAGHYDAVKLIAEAVGKVGDNPKKVADYISTLKNYPAVTGAITFNSDCEVSRQAVFRSVKDGKVVDGI